MYYEVFLMDHDRLCEVVSAAVAVAGSNEKDWIIEIAGWLVQLCVMTVLHVLSLIILLG